MNAHRILMHVAALALAGGAGWLARGAAPQATGHEPVQIRRAATPPSTPGAALPSQPLIAVASDGLVTLRVEQQPLEWVIEQIALQSGQGDLRQRIQHPGAAASAPADARELASAPEAACSEAPLVAAEDARRLFAAIEHGSEAERFDGLLAAVSSSVTVPEAMLKSMFENDASERVRLVALERYLEPRSGDPAALRAALEAALYVPSAAVQQDARRRLDELTAGERPDPSDPQQAPP